MLKNTLNRDKNVFEELLILDNKNIKFNSLENEILVSMENIILNKSNIVLCFPNKNFFPFIVLNAVFKDYFENYKHREDFTRRISVVVITNKKSFVNFLNTLNFNYSKLVKTFFEKHRFFRESGVFCNLNDGYFAQCNWNHILNRYFNNQIPDSIPLNYILPVEIGYFSFKKLNRGERNKIGRQDNIQQSVFYISDNLNILRDMKVEADYIFVDFTYIKKFHNVSTNGILYFFDSPLDDRLLYILNKSQFWNFDAKILSGLPKEIKEETGILFESGIDDLIKSKDVNNIYINYVKSDFEEELDKGLDLIGKLSKKKFDSYDLKIIKTLFYNAIRMPVSATEFDLVAGLEITFDTINELLNELRESDNRYEDTDFENILSLIEDIYYKKGLDNKSPKFEMILKHIIGEIDKGNKIGIIVNNKIVSLALKEQFALSLHCSIDELRTKGLYFYNKKKVIDGIETVECDCLLVYSALNLEDLKIIELCNFKKAILFLYKVEIQLIQKKLEKLSNIINFAFELIESQTLNSIYHYLYKRTKKTLPFLKINKDIESILSDMNHENEKSIFNRKKRIYKGKNAIKAKLIEFEDGSYMFINKEFKVKVLNHREKKYEKKFFSELKIKDELLFINNDVRKELFEVFIENMDQHEKSIKCYHIIREWHELYEEKFYNNRLTDEQLFEIMKNNGWNKTTKIILKNWRSGYSYGPRDLEDIICLGKVLSIEEFVENGHFYYDAMQYIRNQRRIAARVLNKYIFIIKKESEQFLSILDNYNLSIEQLNEAVKIKKIKNISKKVYLIKPNELGILFENWEDSYGS